MSLLTRRATECSVRDGLDSARLTLFLQQLKKERMTREKMEKLERSDFDVLRCARCDKARPIPDCKDCKEIATSGAYSCPPSPSPSRFLSTYPTYSVFLSMQLSFFVPFRNCGECCVVSSA